MGRLLLTQCRPPCKYHICPCSPASTCPVSALHLTHPSYFLPTLKCHIHSRGGCGWQVPLPHTGPASAPQIPVPPAGPFTPREASDPGEGGLDPDSMEAGSEVRRRLGTPWRTWGRPHSEAEQREESGHLQGKGGGMSEPSQAFLGGWGCPQPFLLHHQASLSVRGVLSPEDPIHLLAQGTLRSGPAGKQTLHPWQELWVGTEDLAVEGAKIHNFPTCKVRVMMESC